MPIVGRGSFVVEAEVTAVQQQVRRVLRRRQVEFEIDVKRLQRDAVIRSAVDEVTQGRHKIDSGEVPSYMDEVHRLTAEIDRLLEELEDLKKPVLEQRVA